jgi:hypothetical protein
VAERVEFVGQQIRGYGPVKPKKHRIAHLRLSSVGFRPIYASLHDVMLVNK